MPLQWNTCTTYTLALCSQINTLVISSVKYLWQRVAKTIYKYPIRINGITYNVSNERDGLCQNLFGTGGNKQQHTPVAPFTNMV